MERPPLEQPLARAALPTAECASRQPLQGLYGKCMEGAALEGERSGVRSDEGRDAPQSLQRIYTATWEHGPPTSQKPGPWLQGSIIPRGTENSQNILGAPGRLLDLSLPAWNSPAGSASGQGSQSSGAPSTPPSHLRGVPRAEIRPCPPRTVL